MKKSVLFILIFSAFLFNSCKNFLSGSNVKQQLEEHISFANEKNPLAIESVYPEYVNTGVSCNSPIEIKFNQSIATTYFNFQILFEGESVYIPYFEPVVFNDFNTTATFFPDPEKIRERIGDSAFLDVTVQIIGSTRSSSGSRLDFEDKFYKFRYNNTIDGDRPVITDFRIAKTKDDALSNSNIINEKDFNSWEESDYIKNRAKSVWIYAKGYDYTGGLRDAYVTETLVYDVSGKEKGVYANLNKRCQDIVFRPCQQSSYYETVFEYTFNSEDDGIVKLDFTFTDGVNKADTKTTGYVLKDTKVYEEGFELYNELPNETITTSDYNQAIQNIKKDLTTIYLNLKDDVYYNKDDNILSGKVKTDDVSLKYKSYNSEYKTIDLKKASGTEEYDYYFSMPELIALTKIYDVEFLLKLKDDLGNTTEFTKVFPKQTKILYSTYNTNVYSFYVKDDTNKSYLAKCFYYFDDEKLDKLFVEGTSGKLFLSRINHSYLDENSKIVVYVSQFNDQYKSGKKGLYSIPVVPYTANSTDSETDLEIPTYTYEKIPGPLNSGYTDINFYLTSPVDKDCVYTLTHNSYMDHDFNTDHFYFNLEESPKTVTLADGKIITSYGHASYRMNSLRWELFQLWICKGSVVKKDSLKTFDLDNNECPGVCICADFDNVPVSFNDIDNGSYPDSFPRKIIVDGISDYPEFVMGSTKIPGIGLKTDDNITTPVNIWYTDKFYGVSTKEYNINTELLYSLCNVGLTYNFRLNDYLSAKQTALEISLPGPGIYYCYMQVFDMNNNYNEYPENINSLTLQYYPLTTPKYYFNSDSSKLTVLGSKEQTVLINDIEKSNFDYVNYSLTYQTYEDHIIEYPASNSKTILNSCTFNGINQYAVEANLSESYIKDKFVYVYLNGYYKINEVGTNQDLYAPPFIFYADTTNQYTLTRKKLIDVSETAMAVSSDAPVLVHTLYNSVDFGNNIDDWLHYSMEENPQIFYSPDYYEVESENIPSGYYYCVIAHFADGSTKISKVYQK